MPLVNLIYIRLYHLYINLKIKLQCYIIKYKKIKNPILILFLNKTTIFIQDFKNNNQI